MQSASRLRLSCLLLGLLFLPAFTAGRQATAPAAPHADPLALPVSLSAQAQSLQDLLQSLSPKAGPRLEATEPLQWERVSVFVHRQPLSKIVRGLQELFNYGWLQDPEKSPVQRYLFVSSERERRYEQDLWRWTLERGAASLFELTRYLDAPQETYERLDERLRQQHKEPEDPLLRDNLFYLERPGPRLGLRLLTTLTPEQRMTLLENERLVLTQGEMTEQQKQLTHGLGQAIGEFRQRWGRVLPAEKPEDSAALADQLGIILSVMQHPVTGAVSLYSYGIADVDGMVAASLSDQTEDLLPMRGNPYYYSPARKATLPGYPSLERLPFPADFKLSSTHLKAWSDVVAELAKYVPLPIFSDDYAYTPDPRDRQYLQPEWNDPLSKLPRAVPPKLAHRNLVSGLDALCNQYRYLWWYEDGTLFFRSRTWFIERQYEVPHAVLALLQQHLQRNGGRYDVECLNALSTLTLRQLEGLNVTSSVKMRIPDRWDERSNAIWAHVYLQMMPLLNEAQKAKILSPTGLTLAEMTPQQQQAFVQALFMSSGPEIIYRLPNIRLKAETSQWDQSADPHSMHIRELVFTYREKDSAVAQVHVSYRPIQDEQNPK